MCWTGLGTDRKLAKEDIKCWKVVLSLGVESFFRPPIRYTQSDMIYEVGNTYHSLLSIEPRGRGFGLGKYIDINIGLHCYASHITFQKTTSGYQVSNGDFFISTPTKQIKLIECIIPKWTVYYENSKGEIVTEKLILKKEIYTHE